MRERLERIIVVNIDSLQGKDQSVALVGLVSCHVMACPFGSSPRTLRRAALPPGPPSSRRLAGGQPEGLWPRILSNQKIS